MKILVKKIKKIKNFFYFKDKYNNEDSEKN